MWLGALRGLVQDRLVAACDLGLVEGSVGGEQRFVVRLRARVEERGTDADGGINPAGTDRVRLLAYARAEPVGEARTSWGVAPRSTAANSSPPIRASVVFGRRRFASTSEMLPITPSAAPARCRSITSLYPSTSIERSARRSPFCRERSSSCSKRRRFHRPVRWSRSARSSPHAPCDARSGTPAVGRPTWRQRHAAEAPSPGPRPSA